MSPLLGTFASASSRGYRISEQPSQIAYTAPGTYTFLVPDGVTSIIALAVGGGEGGTNALGFGRLGGDGGSLSYDNAISVSANELLTVVVGAGGAGITTGSQNAGGDSRILRSSTVLLRAKGGGSASTNVGATSYVGGAGDSGGGGAAGYSGDGGDGGAVGDPPTDGTAGAGGGGGGGVGGQEIFDFPNPGDIYADLGFGGGGVGLLGEGSSGAGGTSANGGTGKGGSGGADGSVPVSGAYVSSGGNYGGGGGGGAYVLENSVVTFQEIGGNGAGGAVRILWGGGRSFPSNVGDL